MSDKLENFTADSLQNFIRKPPARSILDEEVDLNAGRPAGNKSGIPHPKPRTARAERIGQILESVSTRAEQQASPRYHDAQIRQHMGELVRMMLQEGRNEDLAVILQTHRQFIEEVLALVRQGR